MSVEQVYMSDVAGRRLEVAREWGASGVVNGSERDVLQAIREWQPGGVTAAVDAVGISTTRGQALGAVVPGGTVVLVGLNEESSPFEANYIVRQEVTLRGSFAYNDEDFCLALELISSGVVTPGASWLEERPLSGGPAAFAELVSGTSNATKIVLSLAE
jgi:threonine dehydrogenase-like Zn-dependent dehydrogenase